MMDEIECWGGVKKLKLTPMTPWDYWSYLARRATSALWRDFLCDCGDHGTAHRRPTPLESEEVIERRHELADAILRVTAEGLM